MAAPAGAGAGAGAPPYCALALTGTSAKTTTANQSARARSPDDPGAAPPARKGPPCFGLRIYSLELGGRSRYRFGVAFLTTLALAVALLVVAPYLAHRLRRLQGPGAAVSAGPPGRPLSREARRRSRLEDRALLATRALAVIGLAVLGATPFVRCSRLALQRSGGASVAIALVVDDSMSMRRDGRRRVALRASP